MTPVRDYSFFDKLCLGLDQTMRTLLGETKTTGRKYPATLEPEADLSASQQKQAAALMRVNHAGEVCAQALYHAQGLVSRRSDIRETMQQAAIEEGDHLHWCERRLVELGSHTSYLNPVWYLGSFAIGLVAGMAGDKWNLGFLAETENQVVKHLESHLKALPEQDQKSRTVLQQMHADEATHRDAALSSGGAELPEFVKKIMTFTSKIMVKTSYWI